MKKQYLFAAGIIIVAFVNCSKNSNSPTDITGTWKLVTITYRDFNLVETYYAKDFSCISENEITINEDSTFSTMYNSADTCFVHNAAFEKEWVSAPGPKSTGTFTANANGYRFLDDSVNYFLQVEFKNSGATQQLVATDVVDGQPEILNVFTYERK